MKLKIYLLTLSLVGLIGLVALINPFDNSKKYLVILKRGAAYNTSDKRTIPSFTYQSADNPNLVALRQMYHLDSVAGTGNQVSQVLNLMYWLHDLVPHNGSGGIPPVKNAMSLLTVCKRDSRALNCRGLATVLNECYLSMGFKSRFVTCLPKDSLGTDNDCHVINMVYINSLKKWIWIDPTVAGYVTDEKGQFLSIEEVRKRMVTDQSFQLNKGANWNHKEAKNTKNWLFGYMAKNLYRFECPASSEYDTETSSPGKVINYVELLPLDYFKQKEDNKTVRISKNKQVTLINYATNNSTAFWEPPTE